MDQNSHPEQESNLRYRPKAGDGTLTEKKPSSEANWHGQSVLPQEEFADDMNRPLSGPKGPAGEEGANAPRGEAPRRSPNAIP